MHALAQFYWFIKAPYAGFYALLPGIPSTGPWMPGLKTWTLDAMTLNKRTLELKKVCPLKEQPLSITFVIKTFSSLNLVDKWVTLMLLEHRAKVKRNWNMTNWHGLKSVCIQRSSGTYSVRMRENTDQKNS